MQNCPWPCAGVCGRALSIPRGSDFEVRELRVLRLEEFDKVHTVRVPSGVCYERPMEKRGTPSSVGRVRGGTPDLLHETFVTYTRRDSDRMSQSLQSAQHTRNNRPRPPFHALVRLRNPQGSRTLAPVRKLYSRSMRARKPRIPMPICDEAGAKHDY